MADFLTCIKGKVALGKLSQKDQKRAREVFERARQQLRNQVAESDVDARAADSVAAFVEEAATRNRINTARQIERLDTTLAAAADHQKGSVAGGMAWLTKDVWGRAKHTNVEYRERVVLGTLHGFLDEALAAFRSKAAGLLQDRAGPRAMVRELFGQDSGNTVAKTAAKAWLAMAEYARRRFNAAGGDIGRLDDWRFPQTHDRRRVKRMGKDAWVEFAFPKMDRSRMLDPETGLALDDRQLVELLGNAWETISSGGLNKLDPKTGAGRGRGKLANRRMDQRILHFKDADSWLAYNDHLGAGDLYGAMTGHMDAMSREIALLEVLGPNPDLTARALIDQATAWAKIDGGAAANANLPILRWTWNAVSGKAGAIEGWEGLAKAAGGVRNLITAARLGSAMLSAPTDVQFVRQTAAWNGLSATKVIAKATKLMAPGSAADRKIAVRLGLIADAWTSRGSASKRFQDELFGQGWSARLADSVLRASGLSHWTQSMRWAFGMEFLGALADARHLSFRELLDEPERATLARAMQRYGIDDAAWDAARQHGLLDLDGAEFLAPERLAEAGHRDAGERLAEMVLTETDFAVPMPDARVRGMLTGGGGRGTLAGELGRSTVMYKSFSVTVLTTHALRGFAAPGISKGGRAAYIGGMLIGLTLIGALSLQLKQISDGKDPRGMDDQQFWWRAFLQSGGLGIFGDVVDQASQGLTRPETIASAIGGPLAGLGVDAMRVVSPGWRRIVGDGEQNLEGALVAFASRYAPGSSLWYLKLAFDRMIVSQLRQMADPKAWRSYQRMEKRAREDFGQRYWWRPGKADPDRLPDFGVALGDR